MKVINNLLKLQSLYSKSRGGSPVTLAKKIGVTPNLFLRLGRGKTCTLDTADCVLNWFSKNWPDDLDWPNDITRPSTEGKDNG